MGRWDQLEGAQVLTLGVFLTATRASFCRLRWIDKEASGMVLVQLVCIDVPVKGQYSLGKPGSQVLFSDPC